MYASSLTFRLIDGVCFKNPCCGITMTIRLQDGEHIAACPKCGYRWEIEIIENCTEVRLSLADSDDPSETGRYVLRSNDGIPGDPYITEP